MSHLPTAIKEALYRTDLEEYIMKCAGWDSSKLFDMVDWEARARAGKTIKGEQRTTIFKLEFDIFATMKRRRQFEKLNDGRCPR